LLLKISLSLRDIPLFLKRVFLLATRKDILLITLNANPLDISGIDENVTVLELVNLVEDSLKGSGATVMRVFLDGKQYLTENSEVLEGLKLINYQKAELVSETAAGVIQEAFYDSTEILLHLEEIAENVSSELRLGNIKQAMEKYLELINGLEWFITIIKEADLAYAAKMAESAYENERQELISKVNEQISAAEIAQENEDWVGVADIVEYEFCEIFKHGRRFIASLMKEN
jgi:hypothetical protein